LRHLKVDALAGLETLETIHLDVGVVFISSAIQTNSG
jgi:hypothetical protein